MRRQRGFLHTATVVAFGIGGIFVTADVATRFAFSRQRVAERAATVTGPGTAQVATAHLDGRAKVRVVLPSPYGK
jgi:hypothetical protein